jgi:HD-GYP domain-containing protein (c-di-GMP phosphodiesterase class II)
MDMDQILGEFLPPPSIIISGSPISGLSGVELAQTLRMQFAESNIYICCAVREGFERKLFIKNGFTDAFLMPMDITALRNAINEALSIHSKGEIKTYRPVKIIDVEPGVELGFETSIYLPTNKRYVKLSHAGDSLDPDRVSRIKNSKFSNIQVPAEQMKSFYAYSAKKLHQLNGEGLSATEKKEKLSTAVRDLISGLFTEEAASFDSGQSMMKDCGEIVKSYILQGADSEWYPRIQAVLGDRGDSYSHSANVSTLAALFSMGLGIGKPEELALAGLLHDIGISNLPAEIQILEPENMTPEQFELYKKHPEFSIDLIKARKIVVSETVMKAIVQHHELFNGTGYPKGFFGDRICKEAQVLALADRFDYLTRLHEGKPLMTPIQAVEHLRLKQVNDPSAIHYNPELLKSLMTLFPATGPAEAIPQNPPEA